MHRRGKGRLGRLEARKAYQRVDICMYITGGRGRLIHQRYTKNIKLYNIHAYIQYEVHAYLT